MKIPIKFKANELSDETDVFTCKSIQPFLNELERLKAHKKPFPSLEDFQIKFPHIVKSWTEELYEYFSQFQYERTVFPKVGDMVEGVGRNTNISYKGIIPYFILKTATEGTFSCESIRPATHPTREEVVAKVESKLDNDELTFDRELVEQFLIILRGDK